MNNESMKDYSNLGDYGLIMDQSWNMLITKGGTSGFDLFHELKSENNEYKKYEREKYL